MTSLNEAGYWPTPLTSTSNPYIGDGPAEPAAGDFGRGQVGDKYDTSPYGVASAGRGVAGQAAPMGISSQSYISNMRALIAYYNSLGQ
jgi:hypothetical protein